MAITVEDGSGLAGADAYVSVADVDAYLTKYNPSTTWDALGDPEKEAAIVKATRYLDLVYAERWDGVKKTEAQALDWPRYDADYKDHPVPSTEVPQAVKDATAEIARWSGENPTTPLINTKTDDAAIKRDKIQVGQIVLDTTYAGGNESSTDTDFPVVEAILDPLTIGGGEVERG
ncbi:MAG: hypothetical protein CMJ75_18635 [Planctomycetaceae bacterium]|nr:hypothetical protein [Planctomycetaceae bacterium]